ERAGGCPRPWWAPLTATGRGATLPRMAWTADDVEQMADDYFRKGRATCSDDGTPLQVQEIPLLGQPTVPISFRCPRCGQQGDHTPTPNATPYTDNEKAKMV